MAIQRAATENKRAKALAVSQPADASVRIEPLAISIDAQSQLMV